MDVFSAPPRRELSASVPFHVQLEPRRENVLKAAPFPFHRCGMAVLEEHALVPQPHQDRRVILPSLALSLQDEVDLPDLDALLAETPVVENTN
jgi:hypothetical protein